MLSHNQPLSVCCRRRKESAVSFPNDNNNNKKSNNQTVYADDKKSYNTKIYIFAFIFTLLTTLIPFMNRLCRWQEILQPKNISFCFYFHFVVYQISQPWTLPPEISECREIENLGKFWDFDLLQFCTCISLNASIKIVFNGCWLNEDLWKVEKIQIDVSFSHRAAVQNRMCHYAHNEISNLPKDYFQPRFTIKIQLAMQNFVKEIRKKSADWYRLIPFENSESSGPQRFWGDIWLEMK